MGAVMNMTRHCMFLALFYRFPVIKNEKIQIFSQNQHEPALHVPLQIFLTLLQKNAVLLPIVVPASVTSFQAGFYRIAPSLTVPKNGTVLAVFGLFLMCFLQKSQIFREKRPYQILVRSEIIYYPKNVALEDAKSLICSGE